MERCRRNKFMWAWLNVKSDVAGCLSWGANSITQAEYSSLLCGDYDEQVIGSQRDLQVQILPPTPIAANQQHE